MKYGYFDDKRKEYVISKPDTPKPWSNYIGNADFGGVVTNNASGYSFFKSAAQGRLLRFRFNEMQKNFAGRFIYIRDEEDGDFWTNSWQPIGKPLGKFKYECRHGSGYTTIQSEYSGIESEVTYFVPMNSLFETWKVTAKNKSNKTRKLNIFSFVEPQTNFNSEDDVVNQQYTQYIGDVRCVDGIINIGSNVNMPYDEDNFENKDQKRHRFFALSGAKVSGYDCDLETFFGPYGNYEKPKVLQEGKCCNSSAIGDMGCATLQTDIELAPDECTTFAVVFGVGEEKEAKAAIEKVNTVAKLDNEIRQNRDFWHSKLNQFYAETPDAAFNSMVNMWSPFNNLMTFYWSRAASMVYGGRRDGLGYRDTVQDIVGSTMLIPEESQERLELMITGQYANGGAKPVIKPFSHNPGNEVEPESFRSDDCMWLFNAIPAFVKETGDMSFYKKVLPFADKGEATVLQHMRSAIVFNIERSGTHNLPCGLEADWNDCIRLGETGETVFVALQLRFAIKEYIDITNRLNEKEENYWAIKELKTLDKNLNEYAWDGEWYLRAYRYDGLKFGSKENEEGFIFMNPQSWGVLSEHATGERAMQVMNSMHKHLATDYGIMVSTPPYIKTDPKIALARLMNPGMKENGGIFNHTQGWAIMAAAKLGLNERAWEYMRNVMPASFNDKAEIRQIEPYVVCQSTHSKFSPRYGAGRLSWLSGTAVWNYLAMTDAILGIKPEYEGLCIDPCIPSEWDGFKVKRLFRGKEFNIVVKNGRNGKGVKRLTLNGKEIKGNLIKTADFEDVNNIEVELIS